MPSCAIRTPVRRGRRPRREEIEWKESPSAQRETLISNDQVKFIVATYSITDARKQKFDFAGPCLLTGQSLPVKSDNTDIAGPESLQNNEKLSSVSGSTPAIPESAECSRRRPLRPGLGRPRRRPP